jgi:serine protease inhibitor
MNKKIVIISILILIGAIIWFANIDRRDVEKDAVVETSFSEEFPFAIFFEVADKKENIFISPYSIHTAMLLAYIGSDGETKEEIENVLGLSGDVKEKAMALRNRLEKKSGNVKVSTANALFLKKDFDFLQKYKEDGEKYFGAEIESLPSTGEPINQWISKKTNGLIKNAISSGPIPRDVVSYLINTIYFKANWEKQFSGEFTYPETFYTADREERIDMMSKEDSYAYETRNGIQVATIPCKGGDYHFHAFMSTDGNIENVYQYLTENNFQQAKPQNFGEIILYLPKFTMRSDLDVSNYLKAMGIERAFHHREANFSQMAKIKPEENIFINSVIHKSFIEVQEKGTEAAAVTVIDFVIEESLPEEEEYKPVIIKFNKPFVYVIEEVGSGTILFIGQLVNPATLN